MYISIIKYYIIMMDTIVASSLPGRQTGLKIFRCKQNNIKDVSNFATVKIMDFYDCNFIWLVNVIKI